MIYQTVRKAQQEAWADIQPSIQRLRRLKDLIESQPALLSPKERKTAIRPWNRLVVEEAVWAVARTRNLITPEQRVVIAAAEDWYECGPDSSEEELAHAEDQLEAAVMALRETGEESSDPPATLTSATN